MKQLSLIAALLVSGCSLQLKPAPEVEKALAQHGVVLQMVVQYLEELQARGVLPKGEELEKK